MPLEVIENITRVEADNRGAQGLRRSKGETDRRRCTAGRSCALAADAGCRCGPGAELLRQAEARAAARGDEIGQEAQAEAERLRREAEKRLDMAADLIVGRVVKD